MMFGFAHGQIHIELAPHSLLIFCQHPATGIRLCIIKSTGCNHVKVYIMACQVHPALVKCSRGIQAYVNVSPLVHLKGSRTVSCQRHGGGFYWIPRLPGTRQYFWKDICFPKIYTFMGLHPLVFLVHCWIWANLAKII